MVYPVKFQTQSDLSDRPLGDKLIDEAEDVYLYILHALMSISVEMSRHLGLLHIMCYLVKVPLKHKCTSGVSCFRGILEIIASVH